MAGSEGGSGHTARGGDNRRKRRRDGNPAPAAAGAAARPRITISAAMSVDGKISGIRRATAHLSSEQDIERVHRLRAKHDAILVGINTVLSDDPLLTVRHRAAARRPNANPIRVILDSRARMPPDSRIMRTSDAVRTILAVSEAAPQRAVSRLRRETHADVIAMGRRSVSLEMLFAYLSGIGVRSVLVEGGGTVNWELVSRRLFDDIVVAVSPRILGGGCDATSLVEGRGFTSVADSPLLRLRSARRLGDHVILWYVTADDAADADDTS